MSAKQTWENGYRPDSYMKGAQGMETQEPYRYMRHGFNPKTGDDEYLLASGEDKVGIIKNKKWVALIANRLNSHAALLAACKATWNYWLACAESAQKHGDVGTSPNVHAAEDEPHLSELANKAAKMTKSAIEQAGEA